MRRYAQQRRAPGGQGQPGRRSLRGPLEPFA